MPLSTSVFVPLKDSSVCEGKCEDLSLQVAIAFYGTKVISLLVCFGKHISCLLNVSSVTKCYMQS